MSAIEQAYPYEEPTGGLLRVTVSPGSDPTLMFRFFDERGGNRVDRSTLRLALRTGSPLAVAQLDRHRSRRVLLGRPCSLHPDRICVQYIEEVLSHTVHKLRSMKATRS